LKIYVHLIASEHIFISFHFSFLSLVLVLVSTQITFFFPDIYFLKATKTYFKIYSFHASSKAQRSADVNPFFVAHKRNVKRLKPPGKTAYLLKMSQILTTLQTLRLNKNYKKQNLKENLPKLKLEWGKNPN